ncbi:hypothetical protein [Mycolicibacterium sp. CR10]|uniref:hypothetical protein n=1 Tax=Mycolicibacterium sp. CR10 TaxID=2562314 RepID=UPI0010BF87C0|nr:hypothetical protein [Mycolicibacterium sp. CR10]
MTRTFEGPGISETGRCDELRIPRWLRFVLICDRAGSSWYIGVGFFFAPALVILSPWPPLTVAAWVAIGAAGLWLGLLGIAMATGLAMVLKSNVEIPEHYWRSILDYPDVSAAPGRTARCSRPASA